MQEHPIIFSTPMVLAILEKRKTMTRQVIRPQPFEITDFSLNPPALDMPLGWYGETEDGESRIWHCPQGIPGDRIWVRETFATSIACDGQAPRALPGHGWPYWYDADNSTRSTGAHSGGPAFIARGKWRPSIFMPREASRILLEVVYVRVEQLQEISDEDIEREGIIAEDKGGTPRVGRVMFATRPGNHCEWELSARSAFRRLWDSINVKRGHGWDTNPKVWVEEFKLLDVLTESMRAAS